MTDAALAPAVLENLGTRPPVPWPVIEACGLPEIGSQLAEVSVHLDPTLTAPFVYVDGTVLIRPDRAATVTGAALILREAIELRSAELRSTELGGTELGGTELGRTELPDTAETAATSGRLTWADRILAHATALVFGTTTLAARSEPAALETFSALGADIDPVLRLHDEPDLSDETAETRLVETRLAETVATRIAAFLAERDGSVDRCPDEEIVRAARALPVTAPTEVLICAGGDDRQLVDWRRGVNRYGIAPIPTPWITALGSCTASTPTARGFAAASRLRRLLLDAALDDELDATVATQYSTMRRTLLAALGVPPEVGADVVFAPSGTDAELIPLMVSLVDAQAAGEPLHTIVVGQHEIGGGSTDAAAGRHFADLQPSGSESRTATPIAGFDTSSVVTTTVDVRDEHGHMVSPDQLESRVEGAIARHHSTHRTLVHVVEGSKTGIRLPRMPAVRRWRERFGDRIDVVVDAAQMRVDQSKAVEHLRSGHMVIVTGSKFFGGPPFSGAVLMPADLTVRVASSEHAPVGVSDYLTSSDVPDAWPALRDVARSHPNVGFMLRWESALTEMRSFHNASPEIRDEVLRQLAAGLRWAIEQVPRLQLVESPFTPIPSHDDRGFDDLPTIFTFVVLGPDGQPLTMDEADAVHRFLAADIRASIPSNDPVLGRQFQLGRPVKIHQRNGEWVAGLRVAVGAPMVSGIVFDHSLGRTWTDRIDRTVSDVADALHKLELIVGESLYTSRGEGEAR